MFRLVFLRRMALALAAFAVLGLAGPVPAGEQVPFRGLLEGSFTVTPVKPPIVAVLATGRGIATHLGQFSFAMPHTVDLSTKPTMATGTFQFTGANGDTVYGSFTGQGSPTQTPGILSVLETMIITGGTGRFAGATGGFNTERLLNQTTGKTIGLFDGAISVHHKGQR